MIRFLYKYVKCMFEHFYMEFKFQYKMFKNKGSAGKSLRLLNPQFIEVGSHVRIKDYYRIECYSFFYGKQLSPRLIIGNGVIIGDNFTGFIADEVSIGRDTILAGNVTIISENHGMNPTSSLPYHAQPLMCGKVAIGEGCWIGQNVSILPGVEIGDKCIVATSAVVNKSVPSYSIVAGVPAKVIKRFNFKTESWEVCNNG